MEDCELHCRNCYVTGDRLTIIGDRNLVVATDSEIIGNENDYIGGISSVEGKDNRAIDSLEGATLVQAVKAAGGQWPPDMLKIPPFMVSGIGGVFLNSIGCGYSIASFDSLGGLGGLGYDPDDHDDLPDLADVDVGEEKAKEKFAPPTVEEKQKLGTDLSAIEGVESTEAAKDAKACVFCRTSSPNAVAVPCGHKVLCAECASIMAKDAGSAKVSCPVCKKEVSSFIRVYE